MINSIAQVGQLTENPIIILYALIGVIIIFCGIIIWMTLQLSITPAKWLSRMQENRLSLLMRKNFKQSIQEYEDDQTRVALEVKNKLAAEKEALRIKRKRIGH